MPTATCNLPPADWVALHARLLASHELRCLLKRNPVELARRLNLGVNALPGLNALDVEALEMQAQGLVEKRWHEVRKLLPQTAANLGSEGPAMFATYAEGHWPEGHRRHLLDAAAFGRHLGSTHSALLVESEVERIGFMAGGARCGLRFHLRLTNGNSFGPGLQILWRNPEIREFVWFLALGQRLNKRVHVAS